MWHLGLGTLWQWPMRRPGWELRVQVHTGLRGLGDSLPEAPPMAPEAWQSQTPMPSVSSSFVLTTTAMEGRARTRPRSLSTLVTVSVP